MAEDKAPKNETENPAVAEMLSEQEPVAAQRSVEEVIAEKEAEREARISPTPTAVPIESEATQPLPPHPEMAPEHLDISNPQTAGVISTLQGEIDKLRREVNQVKTQANTQDGITDARGGGYPWQYFKKAEKEGDPESGWVVCAPGGKTQSGHQAVGAFVRSLQKGRTPLYNYGPCPTPNDAGGGGKQIIPLLRNGGAKEIPPSQVLALKWHVNPPIPDLKFPQVDAVLEDIRHFVCGDCDLELWFMKDNSNTIRHCFRHLRNPTDRNGHGYQRAAALEVLHSQNLEFAGREDVSGGEGARDPREVLQPAQG